MTGAVTGAGLRSGTDGFAVESCIGRRAEQQDSAWAGAVTLPGGDSALMILVADGMGGATGGKLASKLAIEGFRAQFEADFEIAALGERLKAALDAANDAIGAAVTSNPSLDGMGTTLVGAIVHGTTVTWISVGDSLLLRVVDGSVERMNEDHSLAAVLDKAAERGEISLADAQSSSQRTVLRSALTGHRIALIEVRQASLRAGSWLIVASDGILTLPLARIGAQAGRARDPRSLVQSLIQAVSTDMPADQDNTTIAATRIDGSNARPPLAIPAWAWFTIIGGSMAFLGAMVFLAIILTGDDRVLRVADKASPGPEVASASAGVDKAAGIEQSGPADREGLLVPIPTKGLRPIGEPPASRPPAAAVAPAKGKPAPALGGKSPAATPAVVSTTTPALDKPSASSTSLPRPPEPQAPPSPVAPRPDAHDQTLMRPGRDGLG